MKSRKQRRQDFMDGITQVVKVPGYVKGDQRFVFDEEQVIVSMSDIDFDAPGHWEPK